MNSDNIINLVTALISGVFGGIIVSIVNNYLTRRKTEAEIKHLEAETEKIRAETSIILTDVENLSATVSYKFAENAEHIIYDSTKNPSPHDFRGAESQSWSVSEQKRVGPKGLGTLTIEQGQEGVILNVYRTNAVGRYEIWLQKYLYNGREEGFIPKNDLIAGKRKLRISCEAKVPDGEHTLRFVIRNEKNGEWLAKDVFRITKNNWTPINLYFQVPPTANVHLRIDDRELSKAPSSVQIRKLVVAERTSD